MGPNADLSDYLGWAAIVLIMVASALTGYVTYTTEKRQDKKHRDEVRKIKQESVEKKEAWGSDFMESQAVTPPSPVTIPSPPPSEPKRPIIVDVKVPMRRPGFVPNPDPTQIPTAIHLKSRQETLLPARRPLRTEDETIEMTLPSSRTGREEPWELEIKGESPNPEASGWSIQKEEPKK